MRFGYIGPPPVVYHVSIGIVKFITDRGIFSGIATVKAVAIIIGGYGYMTATTRMGIGNMPSTQRIGDIIGIVVFVGILYLKKRFDIILIRFFKKVRVICHQCSIGGRHQRLQR